MIWLVALGSALGGVARFVMVPWAQRFFTPGFPGGTLVVNIAGSLVIGLVVRLPARPGVALPRDPGLPDRRDLRRVHALQRLQRRESRTPPDGPVRTRGALHPLQPHPLR